MFIDILALTVIGALTTGFAIILYRILNDGRFIFSAARSELLYGSDHVFLSGAAGTGKSTLIRELQARQPNVVVLAPTALAANTIGGSTIHSFFKFPPVLLTPGSAKLSQAVKDLAASVKTIVIDEVSMVRVDLMDAVDRALRRYREQPDVPFGGVRMILVGDPYQLPPIVTNENKDPLRTHYSGVEFHHAPAMQSIQPLLFDLKKVFRQLDKKFSSVLNRIRHSRQTAGDIEYINGRIASTYSPGNDDGAITIVFTNSKAEEVNSSMLAQLPGQLHESIAVYSGDADKRRVPCEDVVRFKEGAQVVFINNDPTRRWFNGLIGKITRIDGDKVYVTSREGEQIEVPKVDFIVWEYVSKHGATELVDSGSAKQYPFKLGWAITAHKSQGQTFDRVHIDITDASAFADGQMYVALSRCPTVENLTISRRIHSKEIMVNEEAAKYIESLHVVKN